MLGYFPDGDCLITDYLMFVRPTGTVYFAPWFPGVRPESFVTPVMRGLKARTVPWDAPLKAWQSAGTIMDWYEDKMDSSDHADWCCQF